MVTDMSAFATKSDLRTLKKELRRDIRAVRLDTKNLRKEMVQWKEELRLHFDVVAERMESAVRMFNVEIVRDHSARLVHLETMMGVR